VDGADAAELVELGAAGEPVGQHHRAGRRVAHRGQQGVLRNGPGDVVMAALDAEVPGQPAASANRLDLGTRAGEQC
jgi:hypothetical protein